MMKQVGSVEGELDIKQLIQTGAKKACLTKA